jgi:hypothetical protein
MTLSVINIWFFYSFSLIKHRKKLGGLICRIDAMEMVGIEAKGWGDLVAKEKREWAH